MASRETLRRPLWTVPVVAALLAAVLTAVGCGATPTGTHASIPPTGAGPRHGAAPPPSGHSAASGHPASSVGPTGAAHTAASPAARAVVERRSYSLASLLARTPVFGPPPPPRPVALTGGPAAVPWTHRVPTDQPVVFLTIDDGYVQDPAVLAVIEKARARVTAFLTVYAVNHNVAYFSRLQELGARIESHAITHRSLRDEPYWFQWEQICGSATWLSAAFGRAPTLLRPPYGLKDDTTLRVARTCGYHAGVHWTHAGDGRFAGPDDYRLLRTGDIILLHFQQDLARSLVDVLTAVQRAGLTPALLEDYVG